MNYKYFSSALNYMYTICITYIKVDLSLYKKKKKKKKKKNGIYDNLQKLVFFQARAIMPPPIMELVFEICL